MRNRSYGGKCTWVSRTWTQSDCMRLFHSQKTDSYVVRHSQVYYGRRDGPGKDASMHHTHVDVAQTVAGGGQEHHRKMYHCMPLKSGPKLGKRAG